ncbi:MAG: CotH kinase family protein [Cyclobacteriaceae bacterium]
MTPKHIPFVFFLVLSHFTYSQVNQWQSVISEGDLWQYSLPASQPSNQWTSLGFDASAWSTGASGFGYGDGDDNTAVTNGTPAIYIRKVFNIIDKNAIDQVLLHLDYDDSFVAYLNGQEVARDLISGNPPAFDQFADGLHEAMLYQDQTPPSFDIDPAILLEGDNVLAVEVHNESSTSSDMTAIPILSVGLNDDSNNYSATPSWFSAPVNIDFADSNLPIIIIETINGVSIQDEPKVDATMKILYRGEGERTSLNDENTPEYIDYSGNIRIEFRGSSSQELPKKPYGFTTYDETNSEKENAELLGMPKENDWILNSLAFDPSLIRDYITYNLSRKIGRYATRTQFCEVLINGEYVGLYVLQEKMKADDNRIDITKIDTDDTTLPKLTGGYITKADKTTGGDPVAWSMSSYSGWGTEFIHEVPKPEDVVAVQHDYIKSEFEKLRATALSHNSSFSQGYPAVIDIPSFVDYILLNELASNTDAYQFSTYFHKDRRGKLRAGPIWDINLSYGNDLFLWGLDRSHTDVWQLDFDNRGATFWRDLFEDPDFKCYLAKRWNELTQPGQPFHFLSLSDDINEAVATISEAAERENAKWGTIPDHAVEISNMKTWISDRISWMTNELGSPTSCLNVETPNLVISKIHYHPESKEFDEEDLEFIEIHNNSTDVVDLTGVYFGETGLSFQFHYHSYLMPDERIFVASDSSAFRETHGTSAYGIFSRHLSNKSETISLRDGFGNVIDEVTYSDDAPWPIEADGDGFCLELIDSNLDNSLAENWKASEPNIPIILGTETLHSDISVYPNPAQEYLIIKGQKAMDTITLSTLDGKVIYSAQPGLSNHKISTSTLSTGIYLILIRQGDETIRRKISIQ